MHALLQFQNEPLLRQALTHRSYANEVPGEQHNERLEFLGDALLTFLCGEYLYQRYPKLAEDELTRRRAALVDEKQLSQFAITLGLDFRMRLGRGMMQSGGFQNPNLLSSTFEAVIGAYYLDRGTLDQLRPLVWALFDAVPQASGKVRSNVDAKNRLQEWVQSQFKCLPTYQNTRIGGPDHAPEFLSEVLVNGQVYGQGKACGKKEAEKLAAENALLKIQAETPDSP
jgi:ribonuclease III